MTRAVIVVLLMVLCIGIEAQKLKARKLPKARTIVTKPPASKSTMTRFPATTKAESTNTTLKVESSEPTLKFEKILSTLEERLNATMDDEPFMQTERDRILERTRNGLNQCQEGFRWTNVLSRYRLCVDRQVQTALTRAGRIEGESLLKMPRGMRRMRPEMQMPGAYGDTDERVVARPAEFAKPTKKKHLLPGMIVDYPY